MTWTDDIHIELLRFVESNERLRLTLEEFTEFAEHRLAQKYPNNNHVEAKIRQQLQVLRDQGHLEFVDNDGTYRFTSVQPEFAEDYGLDTTEVTTETTRVPPSLRVEALQRYGKTCAITDVDSPRLLDAAHILPRDTHQEYGRDPSNILILNKLHHTAFDNHVFTIDTDYRILLNPDFTTGSELLTDYLLEREHTQIFVPPDNAPDPTYLAARNRELVWV